MPKDERVITVSNALSICRALLVVPIIYFLRRGGPQANIDAVLLMLLAALTDWLDGFLARRLHKTSNVGRVLDPLADKIAIAAIVVILAVERGFPLWFVAVALTRDLAILIVGLYIARRYHYIVESNMYGKVTATVLALLIIVYTLEWRLASIILLWAALAMLIISSVNYLQRFVHLRQTFVRSGSLPPSRRRVAADS